MAMLNYCVARIFQAVHLCTWTFNSGCLALTTGGGARLVDEAVLEALGLGHQLLGAAVAHAAGRRVADQIAVVDLEDDRLNQACAQGQALRGAVLAAGRQGPAAGSGGLLCTSRPGDAR